jgi:DMSO/TMAO reductase YedYZ molybdopterin-dependent catalytic subunit
MPVISRGFRGRGSDGPSNRIPPGQHEVHDFPVLSAGPTPRTQVEEWTFTIEGGAEPVTWTWDAFLALPSEKITVDIHCVTKWSKLHTSWRGVAVQTLFENIDTGAEYTLVHGYGGYTTNVPLADLLDGKAWVAYRYGEADLAPEHGGPARLLVPHLYFWKSAKWVNGIEMMNRDYPGFWEQAGYHNYGDPWREQRYQGD